MYMQKKTICINKSFLLLIKLIELKFKYYVISVAPGVWLVVFLFIRKQPRHRKNQFNHMEVDSSLI